MYTAFMLIRHLKQPDRAWNVAAVLFMITVFLFAYRYFVTPSYSYMGYVWGSPHPVLLGLTIIEISGLAFLMPIRIEKVSDFILWIIFSITIMPILLVSCIIGQLTIGQQLGTMLWVGVVWLMAIAAGEAGKRVAVRADLPQLSFAWYWALVAGFIAVTIIAIIAINGANLSWVGILDVYSQRSSWAESRSKLPAIGYLLNTMCYVMIPLVVVLGLHRKSISLTLLGIGLQVFVYMQTGFKTFLFGIFVVALLAVLINRKFLGMLIPTALGVGVVCASLLDSFTKVPIFNSFFVRRFLATPGQLYTSYVSFFSGHKYVLLSDSVLGSWVPYPYNLSLGHLIGQWERPGAGGNANVNFLGDGFAQGGWVGLFLAGVVFALLLIVVDIASEGLPYSVGGMIFFMPCVVLSNSSILTAMLTHGLVAAILMLSIAPRSGWEPRPMKALKYNLISS